jgi:hypothetical protein
MTDRPIEQGQPTKILATREGGDYVVEKIPDCTLKLDKNLDLIPGEVCEVVGTVKKTIYTPSDELDMVFLAVASITGPEDLDYEPDENSGNRGASSSSSSSGSSSRASSRSTSSSSDSNRPTPSQEHTQLQYLAQEILDDPEIEETANDESLISEAEDRAKRESRDAAIDPRFSQSDGT